LLVRATDGIYRRSRKECHLISGIWVFTVHKAKSYTDANDVVGELIALNFSEFCFWIPVCHCHFGPLSNDRF